MELEEKLQTGVFLGTNSCAYRNLLYFLQCHQLADFENVLKRNVDRYPPSIDIDHVYIHPINKTLLDIACTDGLDEFVNLLLRFKADPNKLNIVHNRGPVHFAAESGHANVLRVLLKQSGINPNLEAGRETALHFAVRRNDIECVKVLLDHNANPNIPNAKGATPLHVAALIARQEMIDTLINFSRLAPDLDNFWDFRKQTPRRLIMDRFPDFQLPLSIEKKVDFNLLRFYLDANDEKNFLNHLTSLDNDAYHEINESRLITIAAGKNFCVAVRKLLERIKNAEIDVDITEGALVAIKCGHPKILKELSESNTLKFTEEMLITSCRELAFSSSLLRTEQSGKLECLKMILDQPNINVRCQDGTYLTKFENSSFLCHKN
ncbi:hypothetical protein PV327_010928 [Microctonus hyperodae]|uniref:Uncharacterized protein n=1 Tax=Microctonus hyperodae TaxID=165561 RepID=A0AA39C8H1_MICHY|nr:hypothetical protein PV327_010928 [Microctonus hyperodae]